MICDLGFVYFSSVHQASASSRILALGEEEGFCIKKFPQFIEHLFVQRFIGHLFVQRFIGHFVQKSSVQLSFIVTINLSSLALICIISRSVIFTSYDTSLSPWIITKLQPKRMIENSRKSPWFIGSNKKHLSPCTVNTNCKWKQINFNFTNHINTYLILKANCPSDGKSSLSNK